MVGGESRQTVIAPTPPTGRSKKVLSSAAPPPGRDETPLAAEQIGAALSDADGRAARKAFQTGDAYLARHEWANAEQWFRKAILLDGAQAVYHAELGQVLLVESRWPEAEAAFSAAVLLDVDNAEYRSLLKEARSH
jgi:cytochrome c-type biogenesis protein CcmH/NrfG